MTSEHPATMSRTNANAIVIGIIININPIISFLKDLKVL